MSTSTEVALLDTAALVPTTVFAPGGIDTILEKVEAETRAAAAELDISTPKGRKEIASLAYKVARSKTALDDMGKELVAGIKAQASAIDADRKKARDRLDALKDEVRKPLDEFEAAEAARIKRHEDGISALIHLSMGIPLSDTDYIAARLAEAQAADISGFQEFTTRAEKAKAETVEKLSALLEESRRRDAERAELERLRREAAEREAREAKERAEREQREREERAADQARREAEEKARREAEEAERRAAAERERIEREAREAQERAEREKREAEERAAQAERDRLEAERRAKEAEERAEAERKAAAEKAERDRIEAERRAEEERKAAEERARQQAEEAARRERERIEAERRAEEEAKAKREADRTHRANVNNAAVAALVSAGLSEGAAKAAVTAIAKGEVPRVSIAY